MKRKKTRLKSKESVQKNIYREVEHDNTQLKSQDVRCTCNAEDVLPWWFPWFVVIATMAVRIYYVYQPESWWILHPDEIFQSVEVAFADVHEYGFYPYEYLPPPTNISTPAEKQLANMGMYSLRSFLYPKTFAVAMEIAILSNIPLTPFMTCRIFNVIVTSTLPLAVYQFVRRVLGCHLVYCLACALTASCIQLVMFGTHCIVNSFAAPFLFFGLALCLPSQENTKFHSSRTTGRKRYSNMNGEISRSSHVLQKDPPTSAMNGSLRMTNNFVPAPTTHDYVYSEHSVADIKNKNSKNCNHQNESHSMCNNESYINRTNTSKENCQRKAGINRNHIRHSFGGFLIGTLCYIRPDTALYFGIVYTSILCAYVRLFRYSYLQNNRHDLFLTVVGTTLGPCFGVLYDCWRYRSLVISPLNWIKFNLITNKSSALFGSKNYTEYTNIIFYSRYDELLFVIAVLFYLYKSLFGKHDSLTFKLSLPIQISFIFLLICYFSISHKEARFLNNFIVLYFIIISYGLHILIEIASQICPKKSNILTGIILFLLSFCLNTYYNFPSAADALIKKLAYKNAITSKNVNVCLDFISKANDVSGVMIDASIFESNAFSILQNNVPLLTKIHNEYRLYKADSAGKFLSRKGIRVLSSYVDFIDAQNPQYLLRLLGMSNTFNYIVTNRVNFYKVMKYDEIFKSGSYSVLLRNLSVTQEETLNRIAEALPLGMNATILEYETNWLLTAGLYEVAIGRAKRSLELDQSRVRVFQQLMVAYAKINEWGEVEKYQNLCFSVHGQIACEKQQDKIVLYNEYRQFDNS